MVKILRKRFEFSRFLYYNKFGYDKEGDIMRIALVDDEELQLHTTYTKLSSVLESLRIETQKIDCFSSGEALLHAWSLGAYDIIILDIYMDGKNGVDIARKIRETDHEVILAFCTSSNEFASESYEVDARYYLQKPVSEEKLTSMLKRLNLSKLERNRTICLPDGYRCLLRQIIFTEYSNHTVIFHINGSSPHSVYMNHSDAEKILLHYKTFCCINKGCIVNFSMVQSLETNAFVMQNGEVVPIARRRYKEVRDAYTNFHFEMLDKEEADL